MHSPWSLDINELRLQPRTLLKHAHEKQDHYCVVLKDVTVNSGNQRTVQILDSQGKYNHVYAWLKSGHLWMLGRGKQLVFPRKGS